MFIFLADERNVFAFRGMKTGERACFARIYIYDRARVCLCVYVNSRKARENIKQVEKKRESHRFLEHMRVQYNVGWIEYEYICIQIAQVE